MDPPEFPHAWRVDILLEMNCASLFAPTEMRTGSSGVPVVWKTPLGWAIFGPTYPDRAKDKGIKCSLVHLLLDSNQRGGESWRLHDLLGQPPRHYNHVLYQKGLDSQPPCSRCAPLIEELSEMWREPKIARDETNLTAEEVRGVGDFSFFSPKERKKV